MRTSLVAAGMISRFTPLDWCDESVAPTHLTQ
jgi:hypothetical protein